MIAIKRNNGDLYWLDAVLSFTESYGSTVTKHQIEDGASISDHIISENAKFTISGVVSGSEFSGRTDILSLSSDVSTELQLNKEINAYLPVSLVNIGSSLSNPIVKLLPDSLRQFVGSDDTPEVTMGQTLDPIAIDMKSELIKMVEGYQQLDSNGNNIKLKEVFTIVEFDHNYKLLRQYLNCVCTGLSFKEDSETGDAIYPELSFEQVRFVTVTTTTIPSNVSDSIKTQSSEKEQKGRNQPVTSGESTTADPKVEGTESKELSSTLKKEAGAIKKIAKKVLE